MVTIQNQSPVVVGFSGIEVGLTNSGSWVLPDVCYLVSGPSTNLSTNTMSGLRDGAVILVDSSGFVSFTDGADLVAAGVLGFDLCIGTLGIIMATRWVLSRIFSAAGIRTCAIE